MSGIGVILVILLLFDTTVEPLNVITWGQNKVITLTNEIYLLIFSKWDLEMSPHSAANKINQ